MAHLKVFLCAVFLAGAVFSAAAQDLIMLRNGDVIEGVVTEISATEIRYRRSEQFAGPIIVISASTVFMITYADGTREVITPLDAAPAAPAAQQPAQQQPAQQQQPARAQTGSQPWAVSSRGLALGLNLLVGFGVGSFVQGDPGGGAVGLVGDVAAISLLALGIVFSGDEDGSYRTEQYWDGWQWQTYSYYEEGSYKRSPLFYAGWVALAGSKIYQIIRPSVYANRVRREMNVGFAPVFDINGNPALATTFSFKLD
jgi:hypothetical protein